MAVACNALSPCSEPLITRTRTCARTGAIPGHCGRPRPHNGQRQGGNWGLPHLPRGL